MEDNIDNTNENIKLRKALLKFPNWALRCWNRDVESEENKRRTAIEIAEARGRCSEITDQSISLLKAELIVTALCLISWVVAFTVKFPQDTSDAQIAHVMVIGIPFLFVLQVVIFVSIINSISNKIISIQIQLSSNAKQLIGAYVALLELVQDPELVRKCAGSEEGKEIIQNATYRELSTIGLQIVQMEIKDGEFDKLSVDKKLLLDHLSTRFDRLYRTLGCFGLAKRKKAYFFPKLAQDTTQEAI